MSALKDRSLIVLDATAVRRMLTVSTAIAPVREAMIALSSDRVRQLLRSFIALDAGKTFAIMPAALLDAQVFGAKLVSVFGDGQGRKAHEGVVVLFDGIGGAPVCVADAGEVTAIRTAAASAVATDALARPDADRLAVLGIGRQAAAHIEAIAQVRSLTSVAVWGRDAGRTRAFAEDMATRTGLKVEAASDVQAAVADAAIICTVSAAVDPILNGAWVAPGTHVNVVGSSGPMAAEIDGELVQAGRFIVDHREHVLVHGGEFLRAKAQGLVGDEAIAAEIGEVLASHAPGRQGADQITVYKSLGHAAQDLAVTAWLYAQARDA
ncbi:ornithine cyclodeaminase family protein [Caulobacter soli]|uniref:ornithine cyclodeaminase family protein n=1 Tax=Caulobacter soli TaxID=2708539 RepID=UPI00196AAB4E|nr:ornithine cyclodeaminase family protein [Caulobacter soli]